MNLRPPAIARRLVDAYIISVRQRLSTEHLRQLSCLPGATEVQLARLCAAYPGTPPELVYFLQRVDGTHWRTPWPAAETAARVGDPARAPARVGAKGGPLQTEMSGAGKPTSTAPSSPSTPSSLAASFLKATLTGPDSKPVNPHHITVPILGSALGSCPYYLRSVESILHRPRFPLPFGNFPSASGSSGERGANVNLAGESSGDGKLLTEATSGPKEPRSIFVLYNGKAEIVRAVPPNLAKMSEKGRAMNPLKRLRRLRRERGETAVENLGPEARPPQEGFPAVTTHPSPEERSQKAVASMSDESAPPPHPNPSATSPPPPPPPGSLPKVYVDPRIDIHADLDRWLPFADSMHGSHHGAPPSASVKHHDAPDTAAPADGRLEKPSITVSRLFVDFEPEQRQGGTIGQIVQYSWDPRQSFVVIADDFGSYLKFLIGEELEFTGEAGDDEEDVEDGTEPCLVTEDGKVL